MQIYERNREIQEIHNNLIQQSRNRETTAQGRTDFSDGGETNPPGTGDKNNRLGSGTALEIRPIRYPAI